MSVTQMPMVFCLDKQKVRNKTKKFKRVKKKIKRVTIKERRYEQN